MWHVTCAMWHIVLCDQSLKISAPQLLRFRKNSVLEILNESINQSINYKHFKYSERDWETMFMLTTPSLRVKSYQKHPAVLQTQLRYSTWPKFKFLEHIIVLIVFFAFHHVLVLFVLFNLPPLRLSSSWSLHSQKRIPPCSVTSPQVRSVHRP